MDPNDWTLTGNAGTDPTTNFLGTTDNQPLVIKTNGVENLRITENGNVHIGIERTKLAGSKLEVDGQMYIDNVGDTAANQLSFREPGGPNWCHFYGDSIHNSLYFGASDTPFTVPSSPIMTWDLATDNIGIGTTNPTQALQVTGQGFFTSSPASPDPGDGSGTGIRIGYQSTDDYGYINANTTGIAAKRLILQQNGGNVGIGTSKPIAQLEVNSTSFLTGVLARGSFASAAVEAANASGTGILAAGTRLAGQFNGNVDINGDLNVSGTKSFKIDHPLDAAKKYLYHASVESPEMKNIYDGVVVLDARGEAEVTLPAWFEALNTNFRYQLTAIGAASPDLYIAEEMSSNRFKIAGGRPNMKVCWQVTGIRQDAWAKANPLPVEQDKSAQEQGYYLHPELYGESDEKSIARAHYPELEIPVLPKK